MIIGIVGGGQLGLMMAEAAHQKGHTVIGLDPTKHCPLSTNANKMIVAAYNDKDAFHSLVNQSDVITYEFENVDSSFVKRYEDMIPQKQKALLIARDRLLEKDFAHSLDIPTPRYKAINQISDLFYPSILKTRTGGYDGKGQVKLTTKNAIDQLSINDDLMYILEEYVSFDYEISVIASRSMSGDIVTFPIPINIHKNGILFQSKVYRNIPVHIQQKAIQYTKDIITALDYVGTLAVEYFVAGEEVLFNEFAPRPHNSGHYTIEGCNVSQFMNHILAITGEELIQPTLLSNTIMINELGQDEHFHATMDKTICTYHDYHKKSRKHNRKMAHITCISNDLDTLDKQAIKITGETNEY